jgi:hypothetical protein
MMVDMTTEITGRVPRDAGHGTRDTGHAPRPAIVDPRPVSHSSITPPWSLIPRGTERDTGHEPTHGTPAPASGTRNNRPTDVPQDSDQRPTTYPAGDPQGGTRDTGHGAGRGTRDAGRFSFLARRKNGTRDTAITGQQDTASRALRASRDTATGQERDTASRAAAASRKARKARRDTFEMSHDAVAPVPSWMRVTGAWTGRVFGEMPIVAPLIVSGAFTGWAFADLPVPVPTWVKVAGAILGALALEGGLWKSIKTYVATLLNNDSTIGNRLVIALYLSLIAGVIGGHAYVLAWTNATKGGAQAELSAVASSVEWTSWVPAVVAALMGSLGVLVAAKDARLRYRTRLIELELVDRRVPKFSAARWIFCPVSTYCYLRHAVKFSIESPTEAAEDWRLWKVTGKPEIWPVPPGFAYIGGKLVELDTSGTPHPGHQPQEQRDAGHRTQDTEEMTRPTRPTRPVYDLHSGSAPITVPPVSRNEDGTSARDTGRVSGTLPRQNHGTQDTGHQDLVGGTPEYDNGTPGVEERGTQDTNGTRDTDHGTRDSDGTPQDAQRDTQQETDKAADVLQYAEHLFAIVEANKDWRTDKLPSVRNIVTIINDYRVATDNGTFNSKAVAGKVQAALTTLRERPELIEMVKLQRQK